MANTVIIEVLWEFMIPNISLFANKELAVVIFS